MALITKLDEAALEELAALFALGRLQSGVSIAAGTINSNYKLITDAGCFFLRVNEGKSLAEVEYEAAVLDYLVRREIATPMLRRTSDGEFYALHEGKYVSVFDWLPGTHASSTTISEEQCAAMGRCLAQLHDVGASTPRVLLRPGRYTVERLRALFESFSESKDPALRDLIGILREEFAWLDARHDERSGIEHGLVHADLFPDNVLLQGQAISAVLDFEQACSASFAYDLAVTINAWCFADTLRPARVRAMLSAYRESRGGAVTRLPLMQTELRAAALRFTVTRVTDVYLAGSQQEGKDFRRFLMRLRCWREIDPPRLRALLLP